MMPAKDPSAGVVEAVEGMVLRRFGRVAPTLRAAFAGFESGEEGSAVAEALVHLAQTCDNAQGFAQLALAVARRGRRRSWGSAGPHPECSCGVLAIPGRRGSSGGGGNP